MEFKSIYIGEGCSIVDNTTDTARIGTVFLNLDFTEDKVGASRHDDIGSVVERIDISGGFDPDGDVFVWSATRCYSIRENINRMSSGNETFLKMEYSTTEK